MQIIQHWKAFHKVACVCLSSNANCLETPDSIQHLRSNSSKSAFNKKGCKHQKMPKVKNLPEHPKSILKTHRKPTRMPQKLVSFLVHQGVSMSKESKAWPSAQDMINHLPIRLTDVKQPWSRIPAKTWNKSSIRSDSINKTWPGTRVENSKPQKKCRKVHNDNVQFPYQNNHVKTN